MYLRVLLMVTFKVNHFYMHFLSLNECINYVKFMSNYVNMSNLQSIPLQHIFCIVEYYEYNLQQTTFDLGRKSKYTYLNKSFVHLSEMFMFDFIWHTNYLKTELEKLILSY